MPSFRTTQHVRHPAHAMFDLVADVERYPDFVPFCESIVVRARREEGDTTVLVVDMTVGYKLLRERFSSKVTLDRAALTIRADYIDGPFRSMENMWRFEPAERGCNVTFRIDYEFKSRMLARLMGALFDRVFRTFAHAFERRADALYPAGA